MGNFVSAVFVAVSFIVTAHVITEPKNASKLMKRAKETTVNSKGKFNKKKRFGKSIKNELPRLNVR